MHNVSSIYLSSQKFFEKVIEYIGKEIAIFLQLIFSFECLLPTHM